MPQELEFIFRTEDMQKLLDSKRRYIVVKSHLEAAVLQDGSKAGVLKVKAVAMNGSPKLGNGESGEEEETIEVEGCPKPPCHTN